MNMEMQILSRRESFLMMVVVATFCGKMYHHKQFRLILVKAKIAQYLLVIATNFSPKLPTTFAQSTLFSNLSLSLALSFSLSQSLYL